MGFSSQTSMEASSSSSGYVSVIGHRDRRKERLNTELLKAVSDCNVELMYSLLEQGASPNARCRLSLISVSHIAAANGYDKILSELLIAGAHSRIRDKSGLQPHHTAVANGHISALQMLINSDRVLIDSPVLPQDDSNIDVETFDSWNHKHEEKLNLLVDYIGVGYTALHIASRRGDSKCVEYLLSVDADITVNDEKSLSPLDVAGVQMTLFDESDACQLQFKKFIEVDNVNEIAVYKVIKALIDGGALMPKANIILKEGNVVNQRRMGVTALHTAVKNGDLQLTKYLLSKGACLMTWNEDGLSPVHLAVSLSSCSILRSMIKFPGSITGIRDAQGRTPLHIAVMTGWTDGVEILLEAGSDITATTNFSQTVLHIASERGRLSILEELLSLQETGQILESRNYYHQTPLCCAVEKKELSCVNILVSRGADTTFMLPGDLTLLHIAVRNNSSEILKCLLETPGSVRKNVKSKEEKGGMTPLQIAAQEGYGNCIKELLQIKVDVYIETKGETAFHLAAKSGHLEVVQALIGYDQNLLFTKNSDGWYPLHIAAAHSHSDCVRHMILMGADISTTVTNDSGKKTAIDIILYCVPRPVEFLEDIFNSYISVNRFPIHDLNCEIELKYDLLMPNGEYEKQLKVIDAIINCGEEPLKESLLLHPLTESFLYLQWMKLRTYFMIVIFLYITLTIAITIVSHITFIEKNQSEIHKTVAMVARIIMILCLVPIISIEIINVTQLKRCYLTDVEPWVKWSVIICACILETLDPNIYWVHYLASVTVLLSWIELLFLMSRWPAWGFYVLMFSRVASKVVKVLITFGFLMVGFAFAFQILFEAAIPFRSILESIVKVIIMTNEFDYEDMFDNMDQSTTFFVVGRLMFITFVLLVTIVMMNLIVGLSVNDISQLEAQGKTQQLAKQAGFLSFLELCLYSRKLDNLPVQWRKFLSERRSVRQTILLNPAKLCQSNVNLPRGIINNILGNVSKRQNKTNIYTSLQRISNKIEMIAQSFCNLSTGNLSYKNKKHFQTLLLPILEEQKRLNEIIENKYETFPTAVKENF